MRRLAGGVSTTYLAVAGAVPLGAAIVAVGAGNGAFLNLVHVASGAVWAGATVFVAGVLGPSLGVLEPGDRATLNVELIPKNLFLFSSVALATLLTGPVLAVRFGVWDLSDPVLAASVLVGAALLLLAGYLLRIQAVIYGEFTGEGPPDTELVGHLAGRLRTVSMTMLVLQVAVLVVMALLRSPL